MALGHGRILHWARRVVLAAVYPVRYNHTYYPILPYIPLITGTGEQIIRAALARDLCEKAGPNHCEDTVSSIEKTFKLFSGMQLLA